MATAFFPLPEFPPPVAPAAPAASVSGFPHSGQEKSPPPATGTTSRLSALLQSPKLMHFPVRSAMSNLLLQTPRAKKPGSNSFRWTDNYTRPDGPLQRFQRCDSDGAARTAGLRSPARAQLERAGIWVRKRWHSANSFG